MSQCIINADPKVGIQDEDPSEQIKCLITGSRVEGFQIGSFALGKSSEVFEGLWVSDEALVVFSWSADDFKNDGELIVFGEGEAASLLFDVSVWREGEAGFAGEERLSV